MIRKKTAVVLLNLGAPDNLAAVKPFLFNLFYDKAILPLPNPLRYILAWWISTIRERKSQDIYKLIGGKSPLLENTLAQADSLQRLLNQNYKVFTCMRYWLPRAKDVIKDVRNYDPDEIILIPLYPQYSTTTTQSSVDEWHKLTRTLNLAKPTRSIGCYFTETHFIKAYAALLKDTLKDLQKPYRVLFTAHGLPQRCVDDGDPYAWQVEQTAQCIVDELDVPLDDWRVAYQSRVGPVAWLKPYADKEIKQAAHDNMGIVVVPLSFVSEHSETLVELDIQYKELAEDNDASFYKRVPTVGCHPIFIKGLATLVTNNYLQKPSCPLTYVHCICRGQTNAL